MQKNGVKKFSLKYSEKLHLQKNFNAVFKKGLKVENKFIKLYIYKEQDRVSRRMGLVVSHKIGIAAKRNLVKRRLREIFRQNKYLIKNGADIIFIPNFRTSKVKYKVLEKIILDLIDKGSALLKSEDKT